MKELTTQEIWVCNWCLNVSAYAGLVRAFYEMDNRCTVGECDRCKAFSSFVYHMNRKPVLDLMAEI